MTNLIVNGDKQFKVGNWFLGDSQWSKEKYNKFVGLIGSFKEVFVDGPLEEFSVTSFCRFTIQTHGARPVFEVSRLGYEDNEQLKEKVNELLASGFLEYTDSNWSSPAKPKFINGNLELCVNYNRLNEISANYESASYTVPTIPSVLNSISESNIFSKLVLKDAFHQLGLEENSKKMTAFSTDFGHYQFKTFHHGMKNAPRCLQYVVSQVLKDVDADRVKVYLGQVLVHTSNYAEHLNTLRDVLCLFRAYNLKVDLEESQFLADELIYLGKEISKYGIGIDPVKVAKIGSYTVPTNKQQVRSFLGLASQYSNYVNGFQYLAEPLYDLVSANRGFHWDYEEEDAFYVLKNRLISAGPIPLKQRYDDESD